MPIYYQQNRINPGARRLRQGHVVYPDATYPVDDKPMRVIYKKNKRANVQVTRFEVAFGGLARLFLPPELAPQQYLVKNDKNKVVGLVSEHIGYAIANREKMNALHPERLFYKYDKKLGKLIPETADEAEKIPFHFMNEVRSGFFNILCRDADRGILTIDFASLAGVLASSYSLEEDDLHKGNFGFYVVHKQNKPHVVFFKIDHDLMLADSIMSHLQSRFFNWFLGAGAFEVTKRDLMNFPNLYDSQNFYWPTVERVMRRFRTKAYRSSEERQAFANLAGSYEFNQCKWQLFYKHILIPPTLITHSLDKHCDRNDPAERAEIALIRQSVVARQAKLRAVLFAIPEFRDYVRSLNDRAHRAMIKTIMESATVDADRTIASELAAVMKHHRELCQPEGGFVDGDTPLHAAIRLHDYRYHETWQSFGHYAEQQNANGQTPLDLAVQLARFPQPPSDDIRGDLVCSMKHMLRSGAKKTESYLQVTKGGEVKLSDYLYDSAYLDRVNCVDNARDLKGLLRDLGEDYRYSLKMQKELAVICVRRFIVNQKKNPQLKDVLLELKAELNGSRAIPPAPELQFIRQLRSELWIVRLIRGLFGSTTTQGQLNKLIDKEIKQLTSSTSNRWSFFSGKKSQQTEEAPKQAPGLQ